MNIKNILIAFILSLIFYVVVFSYVIHKPITIGIMRDYYDLKFDYLEKIDQRKIIVLAGSVGRFSIRCETIEVLTETPCSNMSLTIHMPIDYQFNLIKEYLNEGDLIYLPYEYEILRRKKEDMSAFNDLPYFVAYDKKYLFKLDTKRFLSALFYFDIRFLISGIGEMILKTIGINKRFTIDTMTTQGDESKHTLERGIKYQEYIQSLEWQKPDLESYSINSYNGEILSEFMEWAMMRNIRVIGGLPPTFNDETIDDSYIMHIRAFYEDNGHTFIQLDNKSQYPRAYFYDKPYHLTEEYQIQHSSEISELLKSYLNQ